MQAGREVALSRRASERPTDDAQQSHDALRELFGLLRDRPEREAANLLRRIRNGESVDNLLISHKNGEQSRSGISYPRVCHERLVVSGIVTDRPCRKVAARRLRAEGGGGNQS